MFSQRTITHRSRTLRELPWKKESFQDIYKLIQADKKIAQSVDTAMFDHISKIEKAVKNYENFLYNQEPTQSPKSTLEHTPTYEKS